MKIALRAGLGFGFVALLVFALGVFALTRISAMEDEAEEVDQRLLPTIQLLGQVNQEFLMIRAGTLRLLISQLEERRRGADTLDGLRKTLAQERQDLDRLIQDAEGKALVASFDQALTRYEGFQRKIVELALQDRVDEAIELTRGELNEHARSTSQAIANLIDLNRKAADAASDHALDVASNAFEGVVIAMVVAFIATIALATLLTRSIVQPLAEAVGVAEVIAGGDLTRSIKVVGNDEPARLLIALQAMQRSLRDTIQGISHSSNQLASAAEELNVVTEDSTRGLHQQNHEIEQAATAVNEMTTAVDEVARNAVATSEASRESDETAQHGRQQVIRTVESIGLLANDVTQTATEVERLAGQVRDISKVLDVIRSIAEQTNLLALNAAIEAARAGEQGRGFAVVADEVRSLASRTQSSAKEVGVLVERLQSQASRAGQAMDASRQSSTITLTQIEAAQHALGQIVGAVQTIRGMTNQIATAAEEQSQVAEDMNKSLTRIAQVADQAASVTHDTAASGNTIMQSMNGLKALTGRFRLQA